MVDLALSVAASIARTFEGCFLRAYRDPVGLETIGVGHRVRGGEQFPEQLTPAEADALLTHDVIVALHAVKRLCGPVSLSPQQLGALIDFAFNLGSGVLQRSTLRQKLLRGEIEAVPAELRKYVYAGHRRLPGLVKRRAAEAASGWPRSAADPG